MTTNPRSHEEREERAMTNPKIKTIQEVPLGRAVIAVDSITANEEHRNGLIIVSCTDSEGVLKLGRAAVILDVPRVFDLIRNLLDAVQDVAMQARGPID